MRLPVVLEPEARAEYDDPHARYRRARKGLAPRFRKAVRDCLARLRRAPSIHQVVYPPDIRRALVFGFPYIIFYRATAAEIRVISVFHPSRDPGIWQRRADDTESGGPPESV
jgi:plasmid stabilization system protein ParE